MILAIDIGYHDNKARCVGAVFNLRAPLPKEILVEKIDHVAPYETGSFFKRELPGLLKVIQQVPLTFIEAIIIDGYVHLDEGKPGLGAHLYDSIEKKTPIIGVAKRPFHNNQEYVIPVVRGGGKKPLYISAIGLSLEDAAFMIKEMHGDYRMPTVLTIVDKKTKD